MPGPSGYLWGVGRPASEPSQDRNLGRTRKRAGKFPYDKPTSYGTARGIDSSGAGFPDISQQHGHPLIPMDTEHTPWDDDTGELEQEASNYPGLFSKASDTGMGGTIPGTAGGWADSPKSWDAEDAVERAGSRPMRTESAWDRLAEDLRISISLPEPEPPAEEDEIGSIVPMFLSQLGMDGGPEEIEVSDEEEEDVPDASPLGEDTYRRWSWYSGTEER